MLFQIWRKITIDRLTPLNCCWAIPIFFLEIQKTLTGQCLEIVWEINHSEYAMKIDVRPQVFWMSFYALVRQLATTRHPRSTNLISHKDPVAGNVTMIYFFKTERIDEIAPSQKKTTSCHIRPEVFSSRSLSSSTDLISSSRSSIIWLYQHKGLDILVSLFSNSNCVEIISHQSKLAKNGDLI